MAAMAAVVAPWRRVRARGRPCTAMRVRSGRGTTRYPSPELVSPGMGVPVAAHSTQPVAPAVHGHARRAHMVVVTTVPLPTVETRLKSSISRFVPGRPSPSPWPVENPSVIASARSAMPGPSSAATTVMPRVPFLAADRNRISPLACVLQNVARQLRDSSRDQRLAGDVKTQIGRDFARVLAGRQDVRFTVDLDSHVTVHGPHSCAASPGR